MTHLQQRPQHSKNYYEKQAGRQADRRVGLDSATQLLPRTVTKSLLCSIECTPSLAAASFLWNHDTPSFSKKGPSSFDRSLTTRQRPLKLAQASSSPSLSPLACSSPALPPDVPRPAPALTCPMSAVASPPACSPAPLLALGVGTSPFRPSTAPVLFSNHHWSASLCGGHDGRRSPSRSHSLQSPKHVTNFQ